MTTAFVAWRSPTTRKWFPVGRLTSDDALFEFVYTKGAQRAQGEAGFQPLVSFPEFGRAYVSDKLFPLFANRLLAKTRREYASFVEWVSLPEADTDPIALLARSGGRRATDALEIFQCPEPNEEGKVEIHFFAHGLQYFPTEATERARRLEPGAPLLVMHDFQNKADSHALMLRTAEEIPQDIYPVGYCPQYLLSDVYELLEKPDSVSVRVLRVNQPPAPLGFRLLCTLSARWPDTYAPFSAPDYLPVAENLKRTFLIQVDGKTSATGKVTATKRHGLTGD